MKIINRYLFGLALRTLRFVGVNSLNYDCDDLTFEVGFKEGRNPFPEPKPSEATRNIKVFYKNPLENRQ